MNAAMHSYHIWVTVSVWEMSSCSCGIKTKSCCDKCVLVNMYWREM